MPETTELQSIDQYRTQIDRIDADLLHLLNERARCALAIGQIKRRQQQPVFVPEREQAVLERLTAQNPGPLSSASVQSVFQGIFVAMRGLEESLADD